MLPVSGMTELSAIPSRISPNPPSRRSRVQTDTASKNGRCGDMNQRGLSKPYGLGEPRPHSVSANLVTSRKRSGGAAGKHPHSWAQTIEQLHSLQACRIEVIVDVVGEIFLHFSFAQAAARRPVPGNALETLGLQAVVARPLKYLRQVERWGSVLERRLPQGPEGKDKGLAGQLHPLLRQIVGEKAGAIHPQRGITDHQAGIMALQHLLDIGFHRA